MGLPSRGSAIHVFLVNGYTQLLVNLALFIMAQICVKR